MIFKSSVLLILFLALGSCSMPSVGYDISIKFSGEFDKSCVKKVFFANFSNAREKEHLGRPHLLSFWADSEMSLKQNFGVLENLQLENGIFWTSYNPNQLRFSSYFVTLRHSKKFLKRLKKDRDAVNYFSSQMYEKINSIADKVIADCGVDVSNRKLSCHPYGRAKRYFKCIEK